MSFFDKTKDVTCVNGSEQFLHRGCSELDKMRWELYI